MAHETSTSRRSARAKSIVGDFDNSIVKQVTAYGSVEITDYDVELVRRMLHRYLGSDEASWSDAPDDYRG